MAEETTKGEKVSKKDKIEQELAKIKEKQKLLEQQRKQIVKVESDKQRKLRARMLIELGAFLFGDRYESAYENMKKDPADFKKRVTAYFEKESTSSVINNPDSSTKDL
jgi:hypothetical protein